MPLPVPVLDHVVVNVQGRLDEAEERYRRLGFALTPRGLHTLGSSNHLAVFGNDYLELLGLPAGGTRRELMDWPVGLNAIVFGAEVPGQVHTAMVDAGLPCDGPQQFSRKVTLPGGVVRDAVFRTVRLRPEVTPAGRLYFCTHATRDLVWRDEWRRHPNGALGVSRIVLAAADPAAEADLFATMFGPTAVTRVSGAYRVAVGLAGIDILTPSAVRERLGEATPDGGGREAWLAALVLRTVSLETAALALRDIRGVQFAADAVTVPAAAAMNVALRFIA
jgi:hypothetical protein